MTSFNIYTQGPETSCVMLHHTSQMTLQTNVVWEELKVSYSPLPPSKILDIPMDPFILGKALGATELETKIFNA